MTLNRRCYVCQGLFPSDSMTKRKVAGSYRRYCPTDSAEMLVGSTGRAQSQRQKNETFTITKYGTPIGTPAYIGRDVRFQASPEEIAQIKKTGFYSQEWRKLRGKA
jgi:hypothetical protein